MTVNRSEYSAKAGERYDVVKPKESDLLRETATSKPGASDIWNKEGGVEQMTVNRSEYSAKAGERYDVVKPKESDLLRGDGHFEGQTQNQKDFQAGRGDRYDAVKPGASDIWNKEGGVEQMTVNRSEYSAKAGERYDVVKPKESDLLRGDGHFEGQTQNQKDFQAGRGDRYDTVRPGASDIWNKEGGVEQMTVNRSEYNAKAGERYAVVKPKESDLLKGDGKFEGKTQNQTDFLPQVGNRLDAVRPQDSTLFKSSDKFTVDSVHRCEFTGAPGERFEKRVPSANLKVGLGDMELTTQYDSDNSWRRRPRQAGSQSDIPTLPPLTPVKPSQTRSTESLFVDTNMDFGTNYREAFRGCHSDVRLQPIRRGDNIISPGGAMVSNTEYRQSYVPTKADRGQACQPTSSLKLEGGQSMHSNYDMEFRFKQVQCLAEVFGLSTGNTGTKERAPFQDIASQSVGLINYLQTIQKNPDNQLVKRLQSPLPQVNFVNGLPVIPGVVGSLPGAGSCLPKGSPLVKQRSPSFFQNIVRNIPGAHDYLSSFLPSPKVDIDALYGNYHWAIYTPSVHDRFCPLTEFAPSAKKGNATAFSVAEKFRTKNENGGEKVALGYGLMNNGNTYVYFQDDPCPCGIIRLLHQSGQYEYVVLSNWARFPVIAMARDIRSFYKAHKDKLEDALTKEGFSTEYAGLTTGHLSYVDWSKCRPATPVSYLRNVLTELFG
ncbi:unnamed protein product, partial [Mesorhabditis spiculigera]